MSPPARGTGPARSSARPGSPTRRRRRSPNMRDTIPIVFAPNMSVGVNVLAEARRNGGAAPGRRATTSRSSRCTTGTRSTRLRAPRCFLGEAAARGHRPQAGRMRGLRARGRDRRTQAGRHRLRGAARRRRRRRSHGDFRGRGRARRTRRTRRVRARISPPAHCAPRSSSRKRRAARQCRAWPTCGTCWVCADNV